jgi:pimeloyl-ACP methyl ester carboxylesterase
MTTEVALPTGVKSFAQWLGPAGRPLFSWLDLPDDGNVVGAVVLCSTMGLEAAYSARALRQLAHRLAASRWAVLRVDYAGTGDSSGTWTDPDLVTEWLLGVRRAIEYARELETPRVGVVGLRIGATLACAAIADAAGVDDMVLWDPCATGKAFLREQRALWAFRRQRAVEWGMLPEGESWGSGESSSDESFEAPGAIFSAQTVADLQTLAIGSADSALATRELVLTREGRKLDRSLGERCERSHVDSSEIVGQEALFDAEAVTPEPTLERIVSWLNEPTGPVVRVESPKLPTHATHPVEGGPAVIERPLVIGPAHLFGVLSEPEEPAGPSVPTIVFLNTGRIGHEGPARFWVDLSRSWSSEGMRCLRVDLSGLGDSPTRARRTDNVEFPADGLDDLREVRNFVTTEFGPDIVLVGLCSGGYHAVEAATDEAVASVCVINPALTYYRWTRHPYRRFEPGEDEGFQDRQAWGATRPWVNRVMSRLEPLRGAARKFPGGWWVLKRALVTESPARMFERLTKSRVRVMVVAGGEETRKLTQGEQGRFRTLARSELFRFETIPNLEHTLLERTGRDRVSELLHSWVVEAKTGSARTQSGTVRQKATGVLAHSESDRV